MNLIDRVAELQKLVAKATCGEWLPGDLETGCIAGDGGHGNVVLRRTNGGSIPSQENIALICGLRNAAHEMLSILREIRPGDAKRFDRFFRECMCPDGEALPECCMCSEGTNEFCDMLRRYQAMAERMEATCHT